MSLPFPTFCSSRQYTLPSLLVLAALLMLAPACGTTDDGDGPSGSDTPGDTQDSDGTDGDGTGGTSGDDTTDGSPTDGDGTGDNGTDGDTTDGDTDETCGPCPPIETYACDGEFVVASSPMPGPDCTCVETEVDRTDCTQTNRRCLDGTCVECLQDNDCPAMGRPQCDGSNVVYNQGRCRDDHTCTMVGVPSFCDHGCEDGECIELPPCPDAQCEGTPGAPSCDDDVWVTPILVPNPDNCDECIEVDQRWLCGGNEVCSPDLGCLPGGCDPCPVFDPPPPFCEADTAVQATGYEQDPVTCVCTETFDRTDCTDTEERCEEGVCVPR